MDDMELQVEGETGFGGETQQSVICIVVEINLNMQGMVEAWRGGLRTKPWGHRG